MIIHLLHTAFCLQPSTPHVRDVPQGELPAMVAELQSKVRCAYGPSSCLTPTGTFCISVALVHQSPPFQVIAFFPCLSISRRIIILLVCTNQPLCSLLPFPVQVDEADLAAAVQTRRAASAESQLETLKAELADAQRQIKELGAS